MISVEVTTLRPVTWRSTSSMPDTSCGSRSLKDAAVERAGGLFAFVVLWSCCTVIRVTCFLGFMIVSYASLTGARR